MHSTDELWPTAVTVLRVIIVRIIEELSQYMSCKLLTMLGLLTSRTVRPTTESRFYLIVDEGCVGWSGYSQSHPALWSNFFVTGPDAFRVRQQASCSVMAAMFTSSSHSSHYLLISCITITVTSPTHDAVHWEQVQV